MGVITKFEEVTPDWLSEALRAEVLDVSLSTSSSNWATNAALIATLADGGTKRLWLKRCLGNTFGRSEVDYYLQDYVDLKNAPLVTCYDASYEEGVGYHILLDDLSGEFRDRKTADTTLEHGLALAEAIARLHSHHWERGSPPSSGAWDAYFAQVEPGLAPLEAETGLALREGFDDHASRLRERWSNPIGLTLLHGDINPTNVLTPIAADSPVYMLDRQPFDWAITYGLAVYDLAYAVVPWWPYELRVSCQEQILRCWYDQLEQSGYSWGQALADWELSVEHCLHVPIEWCREPDDMDRMRGLWEWQFGNILGGSVRNGLH